MAERIVHGYKRLFEVRMMHHYWLDEGDDVFDRLSESARNTRLLNYDSRPLLDIKPTTPTIEALEGLQCKFKRSALGFVVGAPNDISVPSNAVFEFVVTVVNAEFFNYTSLTLRKQEIVELYYQPEKKIRRFKENVFVFSNESGGSKSLYVPPAPVLFLSRPIPPFATGVNYKTESLVGSLFQAVLDSPAAAPPSAGWQAITNPSDHPIYMHQDDAPVIVPPAGLVGVPQRGLELTKDIPDNIFALIRIKTLLPANNFGLLKDATPPNPLHPLVLREPVFELRLKNRSTIWKYYDRKTDKTDVPDNSLFTEPAPLPLTFYGNASPGATALKKRKPSAGLVKATFDSSVPPKVTNLISEIFQ